MSLTGAIETFPQRPCLDEARRAPACDLLEGVAPEHLRHLGLRVERLASGAEFIIPRGQGRTTRILIEGWACRHQSLRSGERQATAFLFPGDLGSCWTPINGSADQGARALTPCRVLVAHGERLADLARRSPVVGARVARAMRADFAILNAWLVNLGQRKAPERIAHLLCELDHRLGMARPGTLSGHRLIPLTQQDIADALGMTNVHVNRVLQRLRANHLVEIRKGALILRDPAALARLCAFDCAYLRDAAAETAASGLRPSRGSADSPRETGP